MKKIILQFCVLCFFIFSFSSYSFGTSLPGDSTKVINSINDPAVAAAISSFKNLSRKERKENIKEVKKSIKEYKAEKKAGKEPSTNTLLLVILAILLPPLAVYLHEGVINKKFWIDLLLTLLFFLPGVIYALVVVLNKD